MDENLQENEDALVPEEDAQESVTPEEGVESPNDSKLQDAYNNQKIRAEKAESERKALEKKLNELQSNVSPQTTNQSQETSALELIKLGKKLENYSEDELEFATEYASSKKPEAILEALDNDMVQMAINASREKTLKEKALKPTGTQGDSEKPSSLTDKLVQAKSGNLDAELDAKEKILTAAGLYKSPKVRPDRTHIGSPDLR